VTTESNKSSAGTAFKGFLIGCGALVVTGLVVGLVCVLVVVGYYNREQSLRNQFQAQEKANEVVFDQVWKTISQQAQVADGYKDAFRSVWAEIVKGTGGQAGQATLAVFVNRINPQFDAKLYLKLMNTVEGQRKEFANNQKKLIDLKREHDDLRTRFPSSLFVGGKPELELHLVTSDRTDEAFRTGRDNDTSLTGKERK
jgi:hypothetical protein